MLRSKKIEGFIEEFRELFDENLWRGEDDSMSLMAIGNVEDWLRKKLEDF